MNVDDMILVSIDDHIIEPDDMFDRHVPEKYKEHAPKHILMDDGIERWVFQGVASGSSGLNAVVTWPKEDWGMNPTSYAEMRPGAYDIHERVRDMNRNGVLASMNFPSFAGFSARFFEEAKDKELALVMLKAYNDWTIDEYCPTYPGRFIPCGLIPVWDPQAMADEVRRLSAKGCHSVTMPELPHVQGLPSYHDLAYWGPFFEAVSDEHTIVNLHIGQGFAAINTSPLAPIDNLIILATQVSAIAAQDLLWGGAFFKYPNLKVAWSEGGIGWIPFYLNRCDRHYMNQRWLGHDFGDKLPSDIFREHSLACYISDPAALKCRYDVGIDNIAWECDYPHSDCIWPDAPEFLMHELSEAGLSDEEVHKVSWQNACRFFDYDPFKHIKREDATVGALRKLSPDVDTTTRSRLEWKARYEASHAS
ncbi:MAG: amidohydrolase family protein [Acidimicrobiia bacterium]